MPTPRAAHAGFGAAGLDTEAVAETVAANVRQFNVLALFAEGVQDVPSRQTAEKESRGVSFGIAADDHHFLAHLSQPGHGVLGGGREVRDGAF